MKLLAQFYACLAIIVVFTAVFNGIEARSMSIGGSGSGFMAPADSRRGLLAEEPKEPPQKKDLDETDNVRMRRAATEEKPEEKTKQAEEEPPKQPPPHKARRSAPEEPKEPKQHQAEETPEQEQKRNRRQTMPGPPGGMPNPEDMAKQMPMPQGRK